MDGNMAVIGGSLLIILDVARWILIAHIVVGWLVNFQVLNLRQPIVAQVYYGLNRLLEPVYAPIRRFLPATGGMDFSPIIVFVAILILRNAVATTMM